MDTQNPEAVVTTVSDPEAVFEALVNPVEGAVQITNAEEVFNQMVEAYGSVPVAETVGEVTDELPLIEPQAVEPQAIESETTEPESPEETVEPFLPCNSRETAWVESSVRQQGAPWFDIIRNTTVTLIGAGGIGSWTALALSRAKIRCINLYDHDTVEEVNLTGQLYSTATLGQPKVNALWDEVRRLCGYGTRFMNYRHFYTADSMVPNLVTISALDNMESRKIVFDKWYDKYATMKDGLFIDGRLSADELQVFCIPGDAFDFEKRVQVYRSKWLFEQSEGEATVCSFKQTSYMAMMIGSIIANLVINYCANKHDETAFFSLPFLTQYHAEIMYFKITNA